MKTVSLTRNKPAIRLKNAEGLYKGEVKEIKFEKKLSNILNRPLYLLDDDTAYGIIQIKELTEEGGMFVYKFEFLSKFPSPKPASSEEKGTLLENFKFTDRKEKPDENLRKLADTFDDFEIGRDFICLTGESLRNPEESEEVSISVRLDDLTKVLKDKIKTRIKETLPDSLKEKAKITWKPEPKGDYLPLFDLEMKRKSSFQIIRDTDLGEIKPMRKFKPPRSSKTNTFYEIDKVMEELL